MIYIDLVIWMNIHIFKTFVGLGLGNNPLDHGDDLYRSRYEGHEIIVH